MQFVFLIFFSSVVFSLLLVARPFGSLSCSFCVGVVRSKCVSGAVNSSLVYLDRVYLVFIHAFAFNFILSSLFFVVVAFGRF